jgi:mRNA-degrading endonuclease RelE of RelBE toxin-antitoxin system
MPEIMLATPAVAEFRRLSSVDRRRALRVMHNLRKSPAQLRPARFRSTLLHTSLFMIRSDRFRLLYEINADRAVILAIESRSPSRRDA